MNLDGTLAAELVAAKVGLKSSSFLKNKKLTENSLSYKIFSVLSPSG